MYNRYIPGTNGNYQRQTIAEPARPAARQTPVVQKDTHDPPCTEQPSKPVCGWVQRFLPAGIDLGDLLLLCIVLLLLVDSDDDDILSILITIAAFLLLQ